MGIYIENIEMPKSCNHCFVTPGCCPAIRKRIKSDTPGYTWIPANYRHEDCPIVRVTEPHWRLIDAGVLMKEMHNVILEDGEDRRTFYSVIERQPTIIPASKEG